eukprot:TRINITY_DN97613_c0_g1_i1.p1 TRINITY_DN97613_c0_g1~~TRINITY_DN97613_c0_g1_i1.p1  ORF type:complete len:252 (-),score=24.84 TRINITY_DN97613_c0_g1_i1:62-817(-)
MAQLDGAALYAANKKVDRTVIEGFKVLNLLKAENRTEVLVNLDDNTTTWYKYPGAYSGDFLFEPSEKTAFPSFSPWGNADSINFYALLLHACRYFMQQENASGSCLWLVKAEGSSWRCVVGTGTGGNPPEDEKIEWDGKTAAFTTLPDNGPFARFVTHSQHLLQSTFMNLSLSEKTAFLREHLSPEVEQASDRLQLKEVEPCVVQWNFGTWLHCSAFHLKFCTHLDAFLKRLSDTEKEAFDNKLRAQVEGK